MFFLVRSYFENFKSLCCEKFDFGNVKEKLIRCHDTDITVATKMLHYISAKSFNKI